MLSFGFKYGLPLDADLVVDMRFLPNPHWIPELRDHTGLDQEVRDYVLAQEGAGEFLDRYVELLELIGAGYRREGKRYLTLAVGCTGGKHRSVAMAEELARRLAAEGIAPRSSTGTWAGSGGAGRLRPRGWSRSAAATAARHADRAAAAHRDLTAVVTVADDGGSSGRLRREVPVVPPGDLRMALTALAGRTSPSPGGRTCSSTASAARARWPVIRSATSCSSG